MNINNTNFSIYNTRGTVGGFYVTKSIPSGEDTGASNKPSNSFLPMISEMR